MTQLTKENAKQFLGGIDAFLFDCDGVLWQGKNVFPGVVDTLAWLRSLGKKVFFVSNNSRTSRREYHGKISSYGIQVTDSEIYSSSYAAAAWLDGKLNGKSAYIIGGPGIQEELALVGIESRGVEEHAKIPNSAQDVFKELGYPNDVDPTIGAVVVGLDFSITYLKVAFALRQIQNNPDVLLVATNMDDTLPAEDGVELPGGGSMVQFLSYCARRPPDVVVGKPNQTFLNLIVEKNGLNRDRTCMVGDKLSTDIVFGLEGGLQTLLVFTGVTSEEELKGNATQPKWTLPALSQLRDLLK